MGRELLFSVTKKDLKVEFFSGTGAGGQYRNKHQNCVRMYHVESGAKATGQSNRERQANLREAFKTLVSSSAFKMWQAQRVEEIRAGQTVEQKVEKMMLPKNLKVEYKERGETWGETPNSARA